MPDKNNIPTWTEVFGPRSGSAPQPPAKQHYSRSDLAWALNRLPKTDPRYQQYINAAVNNQLDSLDLQALWESGGTNGQQ